jgi:hypothetical protein
MPLPPNEEKIKSTLLKDDKRNEILIPDYSDDEFEYLAGLQTKLEMARDQRDKSHDEFDTMTLYQWYDMNEKLGSSFVAPKKNKGDNTYTQGIVRQKLFSYMSYVSNLDFGPYITAFDKNNFRLQALGTGMENSMAKADELDNDEEKKFLRQYELLKQGTVFVEDVWEDKFWYKKEKKGIWNGKLDSIKWQKRMELLYSRPTRTIIPITNVYLGSITTYDYTKQPFIVSAKYRPYDEAKSIYGSWERWKYVTKKVQTIIQNPTSFNQSSTQSGRTIGIVYNNWRLTSPDEDMVEELIYQDVTSNEYIILLNGVLMTPIGMPLPWDFPSYSIVQQNLEPFHNYFAYGKSVPSKLRQVAEMSDESRRLAILKNQKSYAPPKVNLTGRVLSSRIFLPGSMTSGINPDQVRNLEPDQSQGVTGSELEMMNLFQKDIENQTVNQQFATGAKPDKHQSTTESLMMQNQQKQNMNSIIFALTMLEWKLSWNRLFLLLTRWFEPIDVELDEVRKTVIKKYRITETQKPIEGKGLGIETVIPTTEPVSPDQVKEAEDFYSEAYGMPVKIIALNPEGIKDTKITWQISIVPKEKKSSDTAKIMNRGMMQDIQMFGQMIQLPYLAQEFAQVWDKDASKLFNLQQGQPQPGQEQGQGQPGQPPQGQPSGVPGQQQPPQPPDMGNMQQGMTKNAPNV